jgi:hypothetical protein
MNRGPFPEKQIKLATPDFSALQTASAAHVVSDMQTCQFLGFPPFQNRNPSNGTGNFCAECERFHSPDCRKKLKLCTHCRTLTRNLLATFMGQAQLFEGSTHGIRPSSALRHTGISKWINIPSATAYRGGPMAVGQEPEY